MTQDLSDSPCPTMHWLEWEWLLLVLLVLGIYFSRIDAMTIRGEESRRALVAAEMMETGNWIVPRQQGALLVDRPPLGSWPIGWMTLLRGTMDTIAVRLPTVIAVLLTTLAIYFYSRIYLSRFGAMTAAVAFASMGQVLELGRLAENEGIFTFLFAMALMSWHAGYLRRLAPVATWSLGYSFAAAAALVKGPQAPVYFVAGTWLFLILRRDWKYLFHWTHFVGIIAFTTVVGAWQLPYYLYTDWPSSVGNWTRMSAARFHDMSMATTVKHLMTYPLEIVACLLPWSALLLLLLRKSLRASIREHGSTLSFPLVCLAVSFPSVWLATGANTRYYMPLYPMFAVVLGMIAQLAWQAGPHSKSRSDWQWFTISTASAVAITAVGLLAAQFIDLASLYVLRQPIGFAFLFVLVSVAAAAFVVWTRRSREPLLGQSVVLILGSVLGMAYSGAIVNCHVALANDAASQVESIRQKLPADAKLYSQEVVHHLFRFYYRDPIALRPAGSSAVVQPAANEFCCFNVVGWENMPPSEEWEVLGTVSMHRSNVSPPDSMVVVARRKTVPSMASRTASSGPLAR